MSMAFDRRQFLHRTFGLIAATGLSTAGLAMSGQGAAAGQFPPVDGMLGDRRANEFWYQFDEVTQFHPSAELLDAFVALENYFSTNLPPGFLHETWISLSKSPEYPGNFAALMAPVRPPLEVISQVQLDVFDSFYRRRDPRLVKAFSLFAQGVLFDPRHTPPVHTMGGDPPVGYHNWHVFLRAMMLLGIDRRRWAEIAPLNAFGWAVQSVAKPSQTEVNPALPGETVRQLARFWLPRTVAQLDRDFQSFPYPAGAG